MTQPAAPAPPTTPSARADLGIADATNAPRAAAPVPAGTPTDTPTDAPIDTPIVTPTDARADTHADAHHPIDGDTLSNPDQAAPGRPLSAFAIQLRPLNFGAPLRWLAAGWRDFRRAPGLGLFYGACFAAMGWLLQTAYQHAPAYVLALSAGFLLMGPFLSLGLYQASRRLERGLKPDLGDSLLAWDRKLSTLAIFGFVLLVLEMLWARASLVVFAVSFDGMPDFKGSIGALFNPENLAFIVAYLAVGGLFAGLIFAISVVAMPMILDRQTDAITAGLTSLRLVLTQPGVMLWWGALITLLVLLAMLPRFLGLLVVGPWLGHASWHAYREAVVADPESAPSAAAPGPA